MRNIHVGQARSTKGPLQMSTYNTPPRTRPVHPNKKLRQLSQEKAETLRKHIDGISRLQHEIVKYRDTLQSKGGSVTFGIRNDNDIGRNDWIAHVRFSERIIRDICISRTTNTYAIRTVIDEAFENVKKKAYELAREIFP